MEERENAYHAIKVNLYFFDDYIQITIEFSN